MSTVTEEVKPENGKPEFKKKIFYCKACNIMCLSSISLQSHYRGAKHRKRQAVLRHKAMYRRPNPFQTPMKYKAWRTVKRRLMKNITCLKDFMNDPRRQEPLIGLQHVVEIRYEGKNDPRYECKLCGVQTDMAPMMEHLSGYKHRKAYISKEYPDKLKTMIPDVREYKVSFFKQIAEELEKTEGLKMYKIGGCIRPSPSPPSKEEASGEDDDKYENDPVRKQKALEFLETFHISSDSEATLVVHITQELTEALKAFCEKKAAVNCTNSLTPPMSVTQDEFPAEESIPEHYEPYGKSEENSNWSQGFDQYEECSANASLVPANSYSYQTDDGSSSYGLKSNEFAVMPTPRDSFALHTGSPASGINEQLRQFSPSASGGNPAGGASTYETSAVNEYSTEYMSDNVQGSELPHDTVGYGGESTIWSHPQACAKAMSISDQGLPYPNSSATYPSPGRYSTNYSSQSYSSYNSESVNTCTFSVNSAVLGRGESGWSQESGWNQESSWNQESGWNQESSWNQESWCEEFRHQNSDYRSNWTSHQYSFSGSGLYNRDYQQFGSSEKMFDGNAVGLTPNVINRLHRKDVPTVTRMHKELAPARQRVNIRTLVNVLVETREEN